jgi:DNA mismatch repair protein MutL
MGIIRVLPELVVNKIAAGEVVERPSSVVKELIENSLDAQATTISVSIRHGGKSLIKVVDNGNGMDREDAELCLKSHATSKISNSEDIFTIDSFGFRGEALPSIASVSKITLQTRRSPDQLGTEITAAGGRIKAISEKALSVGTGIEVFDLFFNTPARKKFLKSERTEYVSIADAITIISLAYPEVAFKLSKDGKQIFDYPPCSHLKERFQSTHHREWVKHLLPLTVTRGDITIHGYIGKAELSRTNRTGQLFFINKRPVKSLPLSYALQRAYDGLLPQKHFPVAILFLEIDPATVDVNIHPTKREVRLRNERTLQEQLTQSVREIVATSDHSPRVSFTYSLDKTKTYSPRPSTKPLTFSEIKEAMEEARPYPNIREKELIPHQMVSESEESIGYADTNRLQIKNLLGQIAGSYILAETGEGLIILDQHAAHERIAYEDILKSLEAGSAPSQSLLLPVTLELNYKEAQLCEEHLGILTTVGFGITHIGKNTFSIDATPAWLGNVEAATLVQDFLQAVGNGRGKKLLGDKRDEIAKTLACKSYTVKAHETLRKEEMEHIVQRLGRAEQPFTCPHGRPTLIKLTLDDLERQFKRK